MDILKRFEVKVQVADSGCHEWQSKIASGTGYGRFWFDGGQIDAHRMAYMLYKGEIPDGMWVLHRCDNRKCVNPDHLYLGTPRDNVQDKIKRYPVCHGSRYPYSLVLKVRRLFAEGIRPKRIADLYSIAESTVYRYASGVIRKTN